MKLEKYWESDMEYQKETTHICKSATLAREYQFAGNVWLYFFRGRWNVSGNGVEWHNENLTPILRLNIGESTEQDPNGIGQHDSGAKLDAGKPMAGWSLTWYVWQCVNVSC